MRVSQNTFKLTQQQKWRGPKPHNNILFPSLVKDRVVAFKLWSFVCATLTHTPFPLYLPWPEPCRNLPFSSDASFLTWLSFSWNCSCSVIDAFFKTFFLYGGDISEKTSLKWTFYLQQDLFAPQAIIHYLWALGWVLWLPLILLNSWYLHGVNNLLMNATIT